MRGLGIGEFVRALRLPFITVSVLPYIAGALLAGFEDVFLFLLGLISIAFAHLGANLMNDHADSRSGADWQDLEFYGFFGGSKLIQEGKVSEKTYLRLSVACFIVSFSSVVLLTVRTGAVIIPAAFFTGSILALAYSVRPFRLSYRMMGEPTVFLLFGVVPVVGGWFLQTGHFFAGSPWLLGLPFGAAAVTVLFANEVADLEDDKRSGKYTWASLSGGGNAYILYGVLVCITFLFLAVNIYAGVLGPFGKAAFISAVPAGSAGKILREASGEKLRMVKASIGVISFQVIISISVIIDLVLRTTGGF